MKGRTVRRAVAIACSIVFVLLGLLWVRSYWRVDAVALKVTKERALFLESQVGRVCIGTDSGPARSGFFTKTVRVSGRGKQAQAADTSLGFDFGASERNERFIVVPHWFLLLLTVAAAGMVQLGGRFSLRVMLLILPLVVLVIGLLVCLHFLRGVLSAGH
jgi:hypothetical protein